MRCHIWDVYAPQPDEKHIEIVGAATAIVLAAAGAAVLAWRRGCPLADEEAEMFPPDLESLDDHHAAAARSEA